ncbi:MAG: zinc-ribbon domain-containing protein, partial [Candidatus Aminicenantes bacterium]
MSQAQKAESALNCPKCHADITEDSHFCSKCGTSLRGEPGPASQTRTILGPSIGLEEGRWIAGKYKILGEIGRGG